MLDSIPAPAQAFLWPLLGAALILTMSRFLPNWLCRLVALAAAVASLAALWSLTTGAGFAEAGGVERVEIPWEPLNFFRMGPTLYPDSLSLLVGITLSWITAATVMGIRGSRSPSTPGSTTTWYGLVLVALSGCLVMVMAANLLTLALGSALLDFALIAIVVSAPVAANRIEPAASRIAWRMAVPGTASTVVILLSALQMDTQVGTASLLARSVPVATLALVGVAGALRLLIFPLHPRGLHTPENATISLLAAGAGGYLLARTQAISPVLTDYPWVLIAGCTALVAGGLLAWTANTAPGARSTVRPGDGLAQSEGPGMSEVGEAWPGMAIHQVGYAFTYLAGAGVIFVAAPVPWPVISLMLALGMLVIWWDGTRDRTAVPRPGPLIQQTEVWWAQARTYMARRFPALERWGEPWPGRYGATFLPALALISLAGVPLTVGARGRWPFYAMLIHKGQASLLLAALVADVFLAAGMWTVFGAILKQAGDRRPSLAAILAMIAIAVPIIILGIAPRSLGLQPVERPDVSGWGLGLIYVLPWLLGGCLARVGVRWGEYLAPVRHIVNLDWAYRAGDWAGQRLSGAIHWLGQVGEGEGWWGWALIILTLGAMLLTIR